jgi:hypothetical protein
MAAVRRPGRRPNRRPNRPPRTRAHTQTQAQAQEASDAFGTGQTWDALAQEASDAFDNAREMLTPQPNVLVAALGAGPPRGRRRVGRSPEMVEVKELEVTRLRKSRLGTPDEVGRQFWVAPQDQLRAEYLRPGYAVFGGPWHPRGLDGQLSTAIETGFLSNRVSDAHDYRPYWEAQWGGLLHPVEGIQWWVPAEYMGADKCDQYVELHTGSSRKLRVYPTDMSWAIFWDGFQPSARQEFRMSGRPGLTSGASGFALSPLHPSEGPFAPREADTTFNLYVPHWLFALYHRWASWGMDRCRYIPQPYVALWDPDGGVTIGNGGPGRMCFGDHYAGVGQRVREDEDEDEDENENENGRHSDDPDVSELLETRGEAVHNFDLAAPGFAWDVSPLQEGVEELTKVMEKKFNSGEDTPAYRLKQQAALMQATAQCPAWGLWGEAWTTLTEPRPKAPKGGVVRAVGTFEPTKLRVRIDSDQRRGLLESRPVRIGFAGGAAEDGPSTEVLEAGCPVPVNRCLDVLVRQIILAVAGERTDWGLPPRDLIRAVHHQVAGLTAHDYGLFWRHVGGYTRVRRTLITEVRAWFRARWGTMLTGLLACRAEHLWRVARIESGQQAAVATPSASYAWVPPTEIERRLWGLMQIFVGPAAQSREWWALVGSRRCPLETVVLGAWFQIRHMEEANADVFRGQVEPNWHPIGLGEGRLRELMVRLGEPKGGRWQSRPGYPEAGPRACRPPQRLASVAWEEGRGVMVSRKPIAVGMQPVGWEWEPGPREGTLVLKKQGQSQKDDD